MRPGGRNRTQSQGYSYLKSKPHTTTSAKHQAVAHAATASFVASAAISSQAAPGRGDRINLHNTSSGLVLAAAELQCAGVRARDPRCEPHLQDPRGAAFTLICVNSAQHLHLKARLCATTRRTPVQAQTAAVGVTSGFSSFLFCSSAHPVGLIGIHTPVVRVRVDVRDGVLRGGHEDASTEGEDHTVHGFVQER